MSAFDVSGHVRHSNRIEGFDDPVMDACGVVAWGWLTRQPDLTVDAVRLLHRVVTAAQRDIHDDDRGNWRTMPVWVGGRAGAPAADIHHLMVDWIEEFPYMSPRDAHVAFERIHPFIDGNGRTGRLLMWWHEWASHLTPTQIRYEDRHDYYGWFAE